MRASSHLEQSRSAFAISALELPTTCSGCQSAFSLQHALECKVGGFRTIQHNEVRDVFAQVFRDAGHGGEPLLQKLSGEAFELKSANKDDDARSDIKVTGFWRDQRQAFFDVKVVSPFARSYSHKTQKSIFQQAEKAKMREYKARIQEVEHGDFNPLVFTTVGDGSSMPNCRQKTLRKAGCQAVPEPICGCRLA